MKKSTFFISGLKYIVAINIVLMNLGSATEYYIGISNIDYIAFILMIFFLLLDVLLFHRYKQKMISNLSKYILFWYLWLFLGSITTLLHSDNWSIRQPIYFSALIAIITGITIYVTCDVIDDFKFYCKAFLLASVLNYLISFNELVNGVHVTEPRSFFQITTTYVGLGNQNNYATLLLYTTAIAYILLALKKDRRFRSNWLFYFIFIIDMVLSVSTGSATGILGHVLIILTFLIRKILNFNASSIKCVLIFIFGFYAFFVALIFCEMLPSTLNVRIAYLNNVTPGFRPYFLIGLGAGGSNLLNNGWVHNLMFEVLFDYGLIIFAFLFVLLYKTANCYNYMGYYEVSFIITLLPVIWISSSSALSLHFTWSFLSIIMVYPMLKRRNNERQIKNVYNHMCTYF